MSRLLLPLALAAAFALTSPGRTAEPQAGRIIVTGEGESSIKPDQALVQLSVLRDADTAREALTANNQAMAGVIKALKAAGIADRDLQTSGFSINPRYLYPDPTNRLTEPKIVGYSVVNMLSVRVRDLAKLGEILDQSVTLGVNQGGGITFTNDDPSSAITEARKKAVGDAFAKAKTLSEAAGSGIGRVIEISEQSFAPPPMPFAAKAEAADAAAAVPVQAGENAYRVQVTVTFEIKQ